jgi:sulfate permease, SulP family
LFLVAWGLIDFHHIRRILRAGRGETSIFAVTFLSTLFVNLELAILAGVILSLAFYLSRTARPRVVTRVPDPRTARRKFATDPTLPECPQLKIARIDGSLFFGAVSHVQETINDMAEANPGQKHLAIVASGINFVDISGAEFLANEAQRRRRHGGDLWLIRVKAPVRDALEDGGYLDEIGANHVFQSKGEAIAHIHGRLDPEVCRHCTKRIFRECSGAPAQPQAAAASAPRPEPVHSA